MKSRAMCRHYSLTERGRMMARLPIDPRISRMIIEAEREGCVNEILIIASALSIQDPRERPVESEKEADKVHARFADPSSDFMTLLAHLESIPRPDANRKKQGPDEKILPGTLSFHKKDEGMD